MAGVLQHLRSSTLDKRPNPASMVDGQVAINYASGSPGMFFKDSNGNLVKVGPVHVGTTAPNVSPASGGTAGNSKGEQWLDTTGDTYVFKVWDGGAWRSESGTFVDVNGDVMTGALGIIAGSAGSPGLYFSGDTNTGLYSPGADQLAISTNGAGRLFIDASGRVGLGVTTPGTTLDLGSGTLRIRNAPGDSNGLQIYQDTSDVSRIYNFYPGPIAFGTNNTERMRLDSSGRLGLGTSSPGAKLQVSQNTDAGTAISVVSASASTGLTTDYATLFLQNTNTTNNNYNAIGFVNDQGGYSSAIYGIYTSHTSGSQSGALAFSTRNAGTFDERMRITAAGNVGIGSSTPGAILDVAPDANRNLQVQGRSGTTYGLEIKNGTANSAGEFHVTAASSGAVVINRGTTEIARFSSTGLGIGTTSPSSSWTQTNQSTATISAGIALFDSAGTNKGQIGLAGAGTGGDSSRLWLNGKTDVLFNIDGTEAARIDSSRRLLVGTSTARGYGDGNIPFVQVERATIGGDIANIGVCNNGDNGAGPKFTLAKSRGGSVGGVTVVQNGDSLGSIQWSGADGTDIESVAASITAQVDGTPSANDMPGRLVFSTTADGASSPTERLYLYSNGNVRAPGVYNLTTAVAADVRVDADGYLYRSTSSIRYKTDIETLEDSYADAVLEIRPVWFRSLSEKDNPQWGHWGFIAEEVEQIDPRLCTYSTDENDNLQVESVQYDRFVPHLLNLIKRQKKQIEAMEARLTAAGL